MFFQGFVHEPDGFKERDIYVGSAVQDEQRTLETIDVRERRGVGIDLRVLFGSADAAGGPVAVVRIGVCLLYTSDAADE